MDFGLSKNPDALGWNLPPDDPKNSKWRSVTLATPGGTRFFLGAPTWINRSWVGSVYPPGTRERAFLETYAHRFNTIELNSTYYAVPDVTLLTRWKLEVPEAFLFCPKMPLAISRAARLTSTIDEALRFFDILARGLGPRCGPAFLQLPPNYERRQAADLKAFLEKVQGAGRLAVEFRHSSWLDAHGSLRGEAREILENTGTGTVIIDTLGRRDVMHCSVTSDFVLLRFLAQSGHRSDEERVLAWARRFSDEKQRGPREVFIFVHDHDSSACARLLGVWARALNSLCGTQLHIEPERVPEPQLETLF